MIGSVNSELLFEIDFRGIAGQQITSNIGR